SIAVRIVLFDLPGRDDRVDALLRGGARLEATSVGTGTSQWARLEDVVLTGVRSRDLPAILRDPAVYWVEEWAPPRAEDERASQIAAGNYAVGVPTTGYSAWLSTLGADGTGVTVSVADSGFDTGVAATIHEDLRNRTAFATAICANSRDQDGHGTNTASIAVGDPRLPTGTGLQDGSGFFWGSGGAPGAHLWVQKALNDGDCTTSYAGEPNVLAANAFSVGGALIGSHSFTDGATPGNGYTANCALWDARTRDADPGVAGNQPYLVVFSAGNSGPAAGSLTSPHAAKNILSVANSENYRPGQCPGVAGCGGPADDIDTLNDSSSRGPTVDNRLKPDIAAPGHAITGARSSVAAYDCFCDSASNTGCCASTGVDGSNKYTAYTGTSQAAPRIAGAAAIVYDWFKDRFGLFPSPAMAKAILLGGAVDMKTPNIPNFDEGWGRVNLTNSLLNPTGGQFVDQTTILGTTGDPTAFTLSGIVQDPTRPVGATLVWTDPPGAVNCNPCLVNDLDLLATQGATTWRGNSFTAGFSNTAAIADTRNNVERLNLPPGAATCAPIQIKVRAQTLGGDGVPGNADSTDQDFALVTSNLGAAGAPLIDVTASAISGGCDGDAYLDRRETANLTVTLRNAGCAQADGVSATLSVLSTPPGASVSVAPAGPQVIGTLAAGATTPGVWQVTLQDNPASLCAGKVLLQLSITDAAARTWTRTVPVTLDANSLSPTTDTDPATNDRSSSRSAEWSLRACRTTSPTTAWHMGQADCSGIVRDASSQDLVFTYNLPAGALLKTLGFQHAFTGYRTSDFTLTDSVQVDIDPENDGSFVNLATWRQGIDNPTSMTAAGPFDLSPFNATRGPAVTFRFRFQGAANWVGGQNSAAGWDVDDIVLAYDTINCDTGSCPICAGPPPALGNSVLVTRSGGNLTLSWDPVAGATRYNVYRGTIGSFSSHAIFTATGLDGANSCFEPATTVTFADPGGDEYFLVAADNGCMESNLGSSTVASPRPYASPSCSPH
ncbi:MAG TPA: S8 family serine peptidase, partial [Dongiaceae bacterium]|nr:S8 family serine peptidase [Dongiaceae bacterium]